MCVMGMFITFQKHDYVRGFILCANYLKIGFEEWHM